MSSPEAMATALVVPTTRDVLTIEGPDAEKYLQGQLSQDISSIGVGESRFSFVLAPQGKVDGWGRVHRISAQHFEIDVDPGAGDVWQTRLSRFLLRTDAHIGLETNVATLAVRRANVGNGLPLAPPWLSGSDLLRVSDPIEANIAVPFEVGSIADLEAVRICSGTPAWGKELTTDTIPAAVGQWVIDASVSFTKGCYTGQELVARIDSRGGNVPQRLVGVVVEGPAPLAGSAVSIGTDDVGTLTSSTNINPDLSVALAYLARSVELGEEPLPAAAGSSSCTIRMLPLTSECC